MATTIAFPAKEGQGTVERDEQMWRIVIEETAAKAKSVLPESHERIDQAVKLVVSGQVTQKNDGTFQVASQSRPALSYVVVGKVCKCKDFEKAPGNFCKHRLAVSIQQRSESDMARQRLQAVHVNGETGEILPTETHAPEDADAGTPDSPPAPDAWQRRGGRRRGRTRLLLAHAFLHAGARGQVREVHGAVALSPSARTPVPRRRVDLQ